MTYAALAFALGAALLQMQAALPSLAWAGIVPILALCAWRYRLIRVAAALAAGFFWAAGACVCAGAAAGASAETQSAKARRRVCLSILLS